MVHFLISSRLPSFLLQSERTANENAAEERSSSLSVQVRRLAPPTAAAAPALERGLPVQDDAWIANVEGSKRRGDRGDGGDEERRGRRKTKNYLQMSSRATGRARPGTFSGYFLGGGVGGNGNGLSSGSAPFHSFRSKMSAQRISSAACIFPSQRSERTRHDLSWKKKSRRGNLTSRRFAAPHGDLSEVRTRYMYQFITLWRVAAAR